MASAHSLHHNRRQNGGDDFGGDEPYTGQRNRARNRSANTTTKHLNFRKAMQDFEGMFPDLDRDTIESVLRENKGVVQSTIDRLLEIQTDSEQQQKQQLPKLPGYEDSLSSDLPDGPPPAYTPTWTNPHKDSPSPQGESIYNIRPFYGQGESGYNSRKAHWGMPMLGDLPDDFLNLDSKIVSPSKPSQETLSTDDLNLLILNESMHRANTHRPAPKPSQSFQTYQAAIAASTPASTRTRTSPGHSPNPHNTSSEEFMTDEELEQYLEDEKLAVFLQNEEFIRELKHNAEFVRSLEEDAAKANALKHSTSPSRGKEPYEGIKIDNGVSARSFYDTRPKTTAADDVDFKQKLRHMSKSTKKKFGRVATKFSKIRKTPMGKRSTKSNNFTPLEEDHEFNHQIFDTGDDFGGPINFPDPYAVDDDIEQPQGATGVSNDDSNSRRRRLPLPPGASETGAKSRTGGTEEPIVFYSEDNEFSFKNE